MRKPPRPDHRNQPKGSAQAGATLTEAQVLTMRTAFWSREKRIKALAHEANVHYNTARAAILGITWRHVAMPRKPGHS